MDDPAPPFPPAPPPRMQAALRTDAGLADTVEGLFAAAAALPAEGSRAVASALAAADALIPATLPGASCAFDPSGGPSAAECAVLAIAAVLHSAALNLPPDGVVVLLRVTGERLDARPWAGLWADHLAEARRWDDRRFEAVFGQTDRQRASDGTNLLRTPPDDPAAWDGFDHRLAAVFLRRHAPRLAHELALFPHPGDPTDAPGPIARALSAFDLELRDLAGLTARALGAPSVRTLMPYLSTTFGRLDIQAGAVRGPWLLALARLAAYFDFGPPAGSASPAPWSSLTGLRDPGHRAADPAAPPVASAPLPARAKAGAGARGAATTLRLELQPADVHAFLAAERLVAGFQSELDAAWSVLGEVYGDTPASSGPGAPATVPGFSLRRVDSNLPSLKTAPGALPYVPRRAAFEASGNDLLKLLIVPLYGDRPEIGIRELVQNAVDAVRARRSVDPEATAAAGPHVTVTVRGAAAGIPADLPPGWTHWLEVADSGVGMTPDTVCDYYLRAGASFRGSDAWRRMAEPKTAGGEPGGEGSGDAGPGRLIRTGYFGIGALAAFLLGDELQVTTRHVGEPTGVRFATRVDTPEIPMEWCDRAAGTTIRVRLTEARAAALLDNRGRDWDWYCLEDPAVARIDARGDDAALASGLTSFAPDPASGARTLPQRFRLPALTPAAPPAPWRPVRAPGFDIVHWTYDYAPFLTVNGIVVQPDNYDPPVKWAPDDEGAPLDLPNVSVADPDFRLRLTLQRTALIEPRYPFAPQLLDDVLRDFVAWCLVFAPTAPLSAGGAAAGAYAEAYPGMATRLVARFPAPWFATAEGVGPLLPWHLHASGARRLTLLIGQDPAGAPGVTAPGATEAIIWMAEGKDDPDHVADTATVALGASSRWLSGGYDWMQDRRGGFGPLEPIAARLMLHGDRADALRRAGESARRRLPADRSETPEPPAGTLMLDRGQVERLGGSPRLRTLAASAGFGDGARPTAMAAEWLLPDDLPAPKDSALVRVWREMLGEAAVIPYDMAARGQRFAAAIERLRPAIAAWDEVRKKSLVG